MYSSRILQYSHILMAIVISGCTTPQVHDGNSGRAATVKEAVEMAERVCKYAPTVATVLKLIDLGNPNLSKAVGIANAICNAVADSAAGGGPAEVEGVRIEGKFLEN